MLREVALKDKQEYINMTKDFYTSEAVLHSIPQNYIENTFENLMNNTPYAKAYVIQDNEKIAGYVLLAITYSNEVGGKVVWIEEIFIKDEFRGKGLGRKVLTQIKQKHNDAKRFRLEATKENIGAIRLYENLGYEKLDYLQMVIDV